MRALLASLFQPEATEATEAADPAQRERIASAVLLLEMARADFDLGEVEQAHIRQVLQQHYQLDAQQLDTLMQAAGDSAQNAASLYKFLKTINDQHSVAEKTELLTMIWRVAYADGKLDPQEEALLRRIADLLHLPHATFIKTKLAVLEAQ